MSRMRTTALTSLIESQAVGGYVLPSPVIDAFDAYKRCSTLTVSESPSLDPDTAAARVVAAVGDGDTPDLLAIGREVLRVEADRQARGVAERVLTAAVEQAGETAASVTADLADVIVAEILRPALEQLYAKAREAGEALDGYGLEPRSLLTAPARARNAYSALTELIEQRQVIFTARRWVNAIAYRELEHDQANMFLELRDPTVLIPGWKPAARWPGVPSPEDPAARLLWLVSEKVAPARPWLPTVAEQDERWWNTFGAAIESRKAHAMAARAYAGARV